MTCNDFLSLQKTALMSFFPEANELSLNPFASLLFSKTWKWNQTNGPVSKGKQSQPLPPPSLKKDILLCEITTFLYFESFLYRFENLSEQQKIAVTSISTPGFSQSFLKLLAHRKRYRKFNLVSQRWVDGVDLSEEDAFFDELLEQLRIGYLFEPVLFFKTAGLMDIRMLTWLNKVSSSRVFQYASKAKKDEQNPLWFSSVSYKYLQDWLANQIQISIVSHFFDKTVPEFFLPLLQAHLKANSKFADANGLCLTLPQAQKKSKCQISVLKAKLKQEEERFFEYRQMKLMKSMESIEQPIKKKNKRKGKKKAAKVEQVLKQNVFQQQRQQKELTFQQTDNTNSPSNSIEKNAKEVQTLAVQPKTEELSKQHINNNQPPLVQQDQAKYSNENRKLSRSKNLIKVSPKRRLSPQQVRTQKIFDTQCLQQKYSEEGRSSFTMAQDQKSSDPAFSIEEPEPNTTTTIAEKKRRKRVKKQNEKLNEVKQTVYNRLVCRQIDNLVDQLGIQTNALYNHKIISFERVRTFVQSLYPTADTFLFGSNAIGLSLPNSDVDILLTGLQCSCKEQASQFLAQIAVEINAMGWVVSCSTYLWAKVPIVKLQIDTSVPFLQTKRRQDLFRVYNPALLYHLDHVGQVPSNTIKVDITINIQGITSVGYESTVLMREWIIKMPILQKLVLLLKYILSYQGYNSNFMGGIGSYCLFVMVAAYLKENRPQNDEYHSKEFLNILKWYGEDFDNHSNVVWLRQQGACFPSENLVNHPSEGKRGLLQLIDPITGNYMNSSCNEYNNIKMEFRRIYQELTAWKALVENELRLGGTTSPELTKIVQSKKSIDKWLNRLQHKHQFGLRVVIERTKN